MTKDNWIKALKVLINETWVEGRECIDDSDDHLEKKYIKLISQVEKDAIEKTNKRWEDLKEYCEHQDDCILSRWSAGRPTVDGGYECQYGGKWYQSKPVDKTPKCTCGLSDLLEDKK